MNAALSRPGPLRRSIRPWLLAALLAGGACPLVTGAASSDPYATELHRIAAERAAAEVRFRARERECRQRFVVTSCVDDAKAERREAIDSLRAQQLAIDAARRRERAAARSDELRQKAAEDARRSAPREAPALNVRRRQPLEPRHEPGAAAAARLPRAGLDQPGRGARPAERAEPAPAERREREERNRAGYEARQREAAEHREEVLDRATRRMLQHPPAAPLPVPDAASAPRPSR